LRAARGRQTTSALNEGRAARGRKEVSKSSGSSCRSRVFSNLCLILLAASFIHTACKETPPPQPAKDGSNTPPPQQQQQQQAAATTPPPASPDASPIDTPPLADVQGALARVYHDAVTLQTGRGTPFVVGDFNGDDSQDIAMVVTPAKGKLAKINSEYASWLVGDPRKVALPEVHGDVKVFGERPEPVVVRQDDVLLAVIHGYQKEGWRSPLSVQTFLLRNAVGDGIMTRSARSMSASTVDKKRLPGLRGDVIWEALSGEVGFIYWTGANYAWFTP
jgi:hypothetical protein